MYPIPETVNKGQAEPPHVLVVEDESSVAKGLELVMREEGYNVELADTGQKALEKFAAMDFDLVVADLRLPDIDGLEVIQRVKENRPETKIIIITGYPSVASAVQAVKMGVADYLRKPFTDDEVMAVVGNALKARKKDSMESLIIETQAERLIQRDEVIRVLDKASQNENFWHNLMEDGMEALKEYQLSATAKAAILSGDLDWIRKNVGDLSEVQLLSLYKLLDR